jgi:hypothetical protein
MRHIIVRCAITAIIAVVFAFGATGAAANDNNDNRIGTPSPENRPSTPRGGGVPCQGLYNAGVGLDPATRPTGGHAYGTPGYDHVFENDEEKCHNEAVPD